MILVALGLGIVSGSDVLGFRYLDDVHLSNEIANASLVFILLHDDLTTRRSEVRAVALPSGTLVITIAREGEFVVPSGQAAIQANDALLVLADLETARALERRVLETRPPAG